MLKQFWSQLNSDSRYSSFIVVFLFLSPFFNFGPIFRDHIQKRRKKNQVSRCRSSFKKMKSQGAHHTSNVGVAIRSHFLFGFCRLPDTSGTLRKSRFEVEKVALPGEKVSEYRKIIVIVNFHQSLLPSTEFKDTLNDTVRQEFSSFQNFLKYICRNLFSIQFYLKWKKNTCTFKNVQSSRTLTGATGRCSIKKCFL